MPHPDAQPLPPSDRATPVLELREVSKAFGAVRALRSSSLRVHAGSIHALVGENGAGKSTLVKIVAGVYRRDSGEFELDGDARRLRLDRRVQGRRHRGDLPGADALPRPVGHREHLHGPPAAEPRRSHRPRRDASPRPAPCSRRLGVAIDPRRPALGLSIADQQIIEIAKAISLDARLLIMDEPTAALSGNEVARLFAVARSLRDEGRALVFISHRFDEVFDLCDTVTRDARRRLHRHRADRRDHRVADRGPDGRPRGRRALPQDRGRDRRRRPRRVRALEPAGEFHDVSFQVRAGEIVGLAGLVGAGRSEIARAVFGIDALRRRARSPRRQGRARRATRAPRSAPASPSSPRTGASRGWSWTARSARNIASVIRSGLTRGGLLTDVRRERARSSRGPAASRSRPTPCDMPATTMSGGNQQKVVIAKWLATEPRLLIIDEPTRGIDVGTKAEVHRLLSELAGQGMAILMISSELPEVLGMADRVLVVREGRITAEHRPRRRHPRERHVRGHPFGRHRRGARSVSIDTCRTRPAGRPVAAVAGPPGRQGRARLARAGHRRWSWSPWSSRPPLVEPTLRHRRRRVPRPAARPEHPPAPGHRPDDRHRHPQRRPLGRLHPRHLRLRLRQPVLRRPGTLGAAGLRDLRAGRRGARTASTGCSSRSSGCRRW